MAIQTSSSPTISSIISRYGENYLMGQKRVLLYDQFATDYTKYTPAMSMEELMRSDTTYVPFRSRMTISAQTISEDTDLTPQTRVDATVGVTPTSRGDALQWSQNASIKAFDQFFTGALDDLGVNVTETLEALCIDTALAGTWVDRYAARASLDAGTEAHRASESIFRMADGMFQDMHVPGYEMSGGPNWPVVMHPFVAHDIMESTKILAVSEYSKPEIILNWELGKLGRFKFVVSSYAKVFYGAGDNFATDVDTSLSGAHTQLDTTLLTADNVAANVAKGMFWMVGTIESGNTFYPTNERFVPLSAVTTTVTINGRAENGGLYYPHADGSDIVANDSVYTMLFCSPESMVRLYATDPAWDDPEAAAAPGMPGVAIVGPLYQGSAHQWKSLAWKYFGGYGLLSQHRLYRYECAVSYEDGA